MAEIENETKTEETAAAGSSRPSIDALKSELKRENNKKEYKRVLRNTLFVVVVVAALAVLVSSFFVTVLKVTGDSMTPTMNTGEML